MKTSQISQTELSIVEVDWASESKRSTLVLDEIPLSPLCKPKDCAVITCNETLEAEDRGTSFASSTGNIKDEENGDGEQKRDWGAIRYMGGAMVIEAVIWGFPSAFGVFQRFYTDVPVFQNSSLIPVIGTIALGLTSVPYIIPLIVKYPQYRMHMIYVGTTMCALSLLASSFSTKVWHLLLTQGAMYGIAFVAVYFPMLSLFNEWFVEKRGLAYGILSAAGGSTGLGLPFLLNWGLDRYGYATTLRAYSIAIFVLVVPSLTLMRSNPLAPPKTSSNRAINFTVFRTPLFFILAFSNFFQSLVYFLPAIYLPTYASSINLSATQSTLLLVLLNISGVISQFGVGYISDHYTLPIPVFTSTAISSLACFTLWYLGHSFPLLIAFSIIYGLFAGGYAVFYGRFMTAITSDLDTGLWLYGFFDLERGLGVVLAGPLSSLMVEHGETLFGVGSVDAYRMLILAVAGGMAVSCLSAVGWGFVKKERRVSGVGNGLNVPRRFSV